MADEPAAAAVNPAASPAVPAGVGPAAAAAGATGATGAVNGAPWHANIDPSIREFWTGKRYDLTDPIKLVDVVSRNYQNAERFLGVPTDELLRIPKPNADTAEINTFWNRIGVPKEAKEYDFSQLKMADGSEIDAAFLDTMRASLHGSRVAKDMAPNVVKDVIKYLENNDKAEAAAIGAEAQKQTQELEKNWGNRAAYNMTVARDAMEQFGALAGLTKEQTNAAVDALSKIGGIGAAPVLEMFRQIGARMGEAPFIAGGPRASGEQLGAMSKEDARGQIAELQKDQGFVDRLLKGDLEAKRRWQNLHQVMTGVVTTGA